MITIARCEARRLRAVLRRSALGIAHRGPVPPITFAIEGDQVCVRHRYGHLAVEHSSRCRWPSEGSVALPLDALADIEGKSDAIVALDPVSPGRVVARWTERGIPQAREYAVPEADPATVVIGPPASWSETSSELIASLAGATETAADDDTRYAIGCILLRARPRGEGHEAVATDGRQILLRGGFALPWDADVLVRSSPIFACRGLPGDQPWSVGRTDTHVLIRSGPWTLALEIQTGLRFPHVDQVFPDPGAATARLRLDPADAATLADALGRLPGADLPNSPVTVDLNGRIAVRAKGSGVGPATELVLGRSAYTGAPVRFSTCRDYLARAIGLGFREVEVVDPSTPIACRSGGRAYAWQPLDADSAIGPADDAIRVEPEGDPVPAAAAPHPSDRPARIDRAPAITPAPTAAIAGPSEVPPSSTPTGLAGLIAEAGSLHEALGQARSRAGRLVLALRKQKRREKLLTATLASLRQLRLQDVVE